MAKVTGVGGVFFKSTGDRAALAAWYQKHLGKPCEPFDLVTAICELAGRDGR